MAVLMRVSTKDIWDKKGKNIMKTNKQTKILNLTKHVDHTHKGMPCIHELLMISFICLCVFI